LGKGEIARGLMWMIKTVLGSVRLRLRNIGAVKRKTV
jgi:hypothetical protein